MSERIRQLVEKLLKENRIGNAPVPVEKIAQKQGIDIKEAPVSSSLSGALIRSKSEIVIAVNSAQHKNRQRFTIAHELGHFFLHKGTHVHVDEDLRVNWRDESSSTATKIEEIQANSFAAELLMPLKFLIEDAADFDEIDSADLRLLSRRYKVSEQAMKIRLTTLGFIEPF